MKRIAEFTKTTLIGGLLVVLPIYISVLLLVKTLSGIMSLLKPVTAQLPADAQFRRIIAMLIVVVVCFIAGLIVRTGPGLWAKNAFDRMLLEKIPGYTLLRGLAGRVAGRSEDETFAVALVEILEDRERSKFLVFSAPRSRALLSRSRVGFLLSKFLRVFSFFAGFDHLFWSRCSQPLSDLRYTLPSRSAKTLFCCLPIEPRLSVCAGFARAWGLLRSASLLPGCSVSRFACRGALPASGLPFPISAFRVRLSLRL
jgi:hypothetical protein